MPGNYQDPPPWLSWTREEWLERAERAAAHLAIDPKFAVLVERFWQRVEKTDTCWLWTGYLVHGYGGFMTMPGLSNRAHRFAYELLVGPIPEGLVLDHLCCVKHCVRPDHLEAVTQAENARRYFAKTKCRQGHEYTPENTLVTKDGFRHCRTCRRRTQRAWQQRKKAKAMSRHPHADAMFSEGRTNGNERLGSVIFPDGSVAVLPADGDLQVAVTRAVLELGAAKVAYYRRMAEKAAASNG